MNHIASLVLWWAGLFLELLILLRGLRTRAYRIYPIFYAYIACIFLVSAGLYVAEFQNPAIYEAWYWPTQILTLVLGYGVILDILQQSLAAYPGAERFARTMGFGVFFLVFAGVGMHFVLTRGWELKAASSVLECDLRVVEALFLAGILAAVSYYRIKLGRSLRGVILGMGIYVAVSLITLALFEFLGNRFDASWKLLQSSSYLFALAVWTKALWSPAPNPSPAVVNLAASDYEALAGDTRAKLEALRSSLSRTARP